MARRVQHSFKRLNNTWKIRLQCWFDTDKKLKFKRLFKRMASFFCNKNGLLGSFRLFFINKNDLLWCLIGLLSHLCVYIISKVYEQRNSQILKPIKHHNKSF